MLKGGAKKNQHSYSPGPVEQHARIFPVSKLQCTYLPAKSSNMHVTPCEKWQQRELLQNRQSGWISCRRWASNARGPLGKNQAFTRINGGMGVSCVVEGVSISGKLVLVEETATRVSESRGSQQCHRINHRPSSWQASQIDQRCQVCSSARIGVSTQGLAGTLGVSLKSSQLGLDVGSHELRVAAKRYWQISLRRALCRHQGYLVYVSTR